MYPQETRQIICDRIAEGESLRAICREDSMPGLRTVLDWLTADEDFRAKYAQAREDQADGLVDEFAEIEDRVLTGDLKPDAARVVLWSRQWRAEKLRPKKYGPKVETHVTGTMQTVNRIELVALSANGTNSTTS